MNTIEHNLGHLEHIYKQPSANLKASTDCSVVLASSRANIFPFSLAFENLQKLLESRIWVKRSHRLGLYVNLLLDDLAVLNVEGADLAESLGNVLCHAQVWVVSNTDWRLCTQSS